MEKLEALSLALRQKAQGEADLMGLDEEYARASNLRDNTKSKINKYGTVSPLSLVADVINQSRGRKEMRELAPQRTAARTAISDNANALPLYQEQQNQAARELTAENLEFDRDTALTKTKKAEKLRLAELALAAKIRNEELALAAKIRGEDMDIDKNALKLEQKRYNLERITGQENLIDKNAIEKQAALQKTINKVAEEEQKAKTALDFDKETQGETVELINLNNPEASPVIVREYNGKYYDQNTQEPFDSTGYTKKPTTNRSSGSRYVRDKTIDPYGNQVVVVFDKQTSEETIATFGDGTKYTKEEAIRRGDEQVNQASKIAGGKEAAKLSEKRQAELIQGTKSRAKSLSSVNQAIKALQNGASSGDIESNLPTWMVWNGNETIKLRNAKKKLGLEQIGEYTFGSLSEAEGLWVQESQIPNLDEEELLLYMKNRREAMIRINEASEYEREALEAGEEIDTRLITEMLSRGGFDMSNEFGYK